MAWHTLLDQHRVVDALRRTLDSGRVAHAYLFYGPDGVGKRATALVFARALLCEQGGSQPCDHCPACSRTARMLHPDVHLLFPYPTDVDERDVGERLRRLAENPYAPIDFVRRPSLADPAKTSNKQAFYPVARINEEVRRAMSFKPVEGRYKITIMTDADLLRTEAANAFLKLLEEPTPQTVFILTTSRPDRLLPTILSRCQRIRFDPLPAEAIEAALVDREHCDPAAAATLARMADGSYARALDLAANDELMASRQLVLDFVRFAYALNVDRLADLIDDMSKGGRERLKGMMGLLLVWMRDLMLYRALEAGAPLVNVDQAEAVARFCRNVPAADLEAMVGLVEQAIELVERNVHAGLTLTVLAHALGRAMRGAPPEALYIPLTTPTPVEEPA